MPRYADGSGVGHDFSWEKELFDLEKKQPRSGLLDNQSVHTPPSHEVPPTSVSPSLETSCSLVNFLSRSIFGQFTQIPQDKHGDGSAHREWRQWDLSVIYTRRPVAEIRAGIPRLSYRKF